MIEIPKGSRNKYEYGKKIGTDGWCGRDVAEKIINECRERYQVESDD